jgi:hypothetical protein
VVVSSIHVPFVLSIEDMRNNRDATGRDGHPHVAFVMEGGGASWWRAGDRSSNLLLGQALTQPIQRGVVCYISTGSPKEKLISPIQRRVIYNTWLEASSISCVQQIIDSILVIPPTVVGPSRALFSLFSFAFSAPVSAPAIPARA